MNIQYYKIFIFKHIIFKRMISNLKFLLIGLNILYFLFWCTFLVRQSLISISTALLAPQLLALTVGRITRSAHTFIMKTFGSHHRGGPTFMAANIVKMPRFTAKTTKYNYDSWLDNISCVQNIKKLIICIYCCYFLRKCNLIKN